MIYRFLYRPIQIIISKLFGKREFKNQLIRYLKENRYNEIHDIGCSDGILAKSLNLDNIKYYGYDIDTVNIEKAKIEFKKKKNIFFFFKSIDEIKVTKNKNKIFILIGVFHHLRNDQILKFTEQLSFHDHVVAIDGFYHKNQNIISTILKKLDRGNFIREYDEYKKLLQNFTFSKKINYYLRFYSHLLSFKNIDKAKIKRYF